MATPSDHHDITGSRVGDGSVDRLIAIRNCLHQSVSRIPRAFSYLAAQVVGVIEERALIGDEDDIGETGGYETQGHTLARVTSTGRTADHDDLADRQRP